MKTTFYLALVLLLVLGCSSDDENAPPPVDFREAFVGSYQAESHYSHILITNIADTTIVMDTKGKVEISLDEESTDKIVLDIEDFTFSIMKGLIGQNSGVSLEIEDIPVEVSEDDFVLDAVDFKITNGIDSYNGLLTGQGELDENGFTLDYNIVISVPQEQETITYGGEAPLIKQ